ncbi:MAG TPA: beta-ketoacyl-ACP synthase III [bacterium]
MNLHFKIAGTGSFVPAKVISNADLSHMVDTSDEWITERTGIKERRMANEGQGSARMAYHASLRALKQAKTEAKDLDIIIFGTVTPDFYMPSAACILQDQLGAKKALAFDISAACSGFLYSLVIAESLVKQGKGKKALVVGADTLSKFTDYSDRSTCILFGDGAGAVVLSSGRRDCGLVSWRLYSDGSRWGLLNIPGGGSVYPPADKTLMKRMHFIKMNGRKIFKFAVKLMVDAAEEVLDDAGLDIRDVDLFIPHQANIRIIESVVRNLRIDKDKVFVNLALYGNTSAASIPIALDEAVRKGRVKKGDRVLLASFGSGLTWGAVLLRW